MLTNYANYYVYEPFVRNRDQKFTIDIDDINIDTFGDYFNGCMNMFRDAPREIDVSGACSAALFRNYEIPEDDMDYLCHTSMYVNFRGKITVPLKAPDLLFNLAAWYAVIRTGQLVQPRHVLFDPRYMTRATIKGFMDKFIIPQTRKTFNNRDINAILDDTSNLFKQADHFSMYLMDTINLEDNLTLMNIDKEFYDTLHADLSDVPIDDFKKAGMDLTNKAIKIIMNSGNVMPYSHNLAIAFRSGEGINPKQYKEFAHSIGPKPDGNGGVFSVPINASFINGGVKDPLYYMIDSSAGRTAQILSKINVGDSGAFARLLGLNNTDTFLNPDPMYDCHTKNFQKITIASVDHLKRLGGRYYRFNKDGMEYYLDRNDDSLIGKTIYLRSPMTCASNAKGHGICYRCYGDLAYVNRNVNIGKMASEILSSRLTQRLLSAKHLLETVIRKIEWVDDFYRFFEIEGNAVKLQEDIDTRSFSIVIDPDDLDMENRLDFSGGDDDDTEVSTDTYNEFITKFTIVSKAGEEMEIHTNDYGKLYLSTTFNNIIRRKAVNRDDKFVIPMSAIGQDDYIFFLIIHNNELSKTMEELMDIINKNAITKSMDKDQLLQTFLDTTIKGDLMISSVHCEVILSNQLRDTDNVLEKPDWSSINAPYQIYTLNDALKNNPSIIITLMYQSLSKILYNPLSFKKNGTSFIDLFFMENPTEHLKSTTEIIDGSPDTDGKKKLVQGFIKVEDE